MSRYATNTSVSVEKSKGEIEKTLSRYGADQFVTGWDASGKAMIGFRFNRKMVQIVLTLPQEEAFKYTPGRKYIRRVEDRKRAHEQACRSHWRALLLLVKAKLEGVEAGISTFEQEFLANIMLPNGSTVGQALAPQLESAYASGKMPALLPGSVSGS